MSSSSIVKFVFVPWMKCSSTRRKSSSKLIIVINLGSFINDVINDFLKIFMLQTTTDGKKTSSKDTVGDSSPYETVASRNSENNNSDLYY